MKNTNTTDSHSRFNFLKTMFKQAPLSKSELDELHVLAKKLDHKLAKYIEDNYNNLV